MAYDYINKLDTIGVIEETRDKRPSEYNAESLLTHAFDG